MLLVRGAYKLSNKQFGKFDERMTRDKMELLGMHFFLEATKKLKTDNLRVVSLTTESLGELMASNNNDDMEQGKFQVLHQQFYIFLSNFIF